MQAGTAADIGARIETLYGLPLPDLHQHVATHPGGTMLAALLKLHSDTELAERTIEVQRERLRELTDPKRQIGDFATRHLLDAAQHLALAATARNAHLAAATAVLQSLRRAAPPIAGPVSAARNRPVLSADMLRAR